MQPKFVVVTFPLANDKLSRWQRQRQLYANKHYTGQHSNSTQLTVGWGRGRGRGRKSQNEL